MRRDFSAFCDYDAVRRIEEDPTGLLNKGSIKIIPVTASLIPYVFPTWLQYSSERFNSQATHT